MLIFKIVFIPPEMLEVHNLSGNIPQVKPGGVLRLINMRVFKN